MADSIFCQSGISQQHLFGEVFLDFFFLGYYETTNKIWIFLKKDCSHFWWVYKKKKNKVQIDTYTINISLIRDIMTDIFLDLGLWKTTVF